MPTEKKIRELEEIKQKVSNSNAFVVTSYRGLTANEMNELRKKLTQSQITYKIYKNTLMRLATTELKSSELQDVLKGTTAVAFSKDGAVSLSKILFQFSKDHPHLQILGGYAEAQFMDQKQISVLASLPTRNELLGMLVGALSGNLRKLAVLVDMISKKKSEGKEG